MKGREGRGLWLEGDSFFRFITTTASDATKGKNRLLPGAFMVEGFVLYITAKSYGLP